MSNVNETAASAGQPAKKGWGLFTLTAMGVGGVVGSGVVTLVGVAIGISGRSAWLAYSLAVVIGFLTLLPMIMLTSVLKVRGGIYSLAVLLLGDVWAGISGLILGFFGFACGLYSLSLGGYVSSLFPGLDIRVGALAGLTLFYLVNLCGIDFAAKVQNILTVLLNAGLVIFIIVGLTKVTPGTFAFSDPGFFANGVKGFFGATIVLLFSTVGHSASLPVYSGNAQNAKRDIPLAFILTSLIILVVYTGVGIVTGGVLPIKEVAGKPLTILAKTIFPFAGFVLFMIFVPFMALSTTINAYLPVFARPFEQMSYDGWLPAKLNVVNKKGVHYIYLTLIYLLGAVPVLFKLNIGPMANALVIMANIPNLIVACAALRLPNMLRDAWDARWYKYSKGFYYAVVCIGLAAAIFVQALAISNLNRTMAIICVVEVVLFTVYTLLVKKYGRVDMKKSYEY